MDKFDKSRFKEQKRHLERAGLPAIWIGSDRYCSPFPDLKAGMAGILLRSDNPDYPDMFYPEAWNHRYPIKALPENVRVTGVTVQHQPSLL